VGADGDQFHAPGAVETIRQTQLTSLLRQKRVVLGIMATPNYKVDHGRVVMDPFTQQPVIDKDLVLKASAELRRIEDAISRLTGTRAPVVHEVHEITEDAIDAEIRRLGQLLGTGTVDRALQRGEAGTPAALEAGGGEG